METKISNQYQITIYTKVYNTILLEEKKSIELFRNHTNEKTKCESTRMRRWILDIWFRDLFHKFITNIVLKIHKVKKNVYMKSLQEYNFALHTLDFSWRSQKEKAYEVEG